VAGHSLSIIRSFAILILVGAHTSAFAQSSGCGALALAGTVVGETTAKALVASSEAEERLVGVGDLIQGCRVAEIDRRRVVLTRGDNRYLMLLAGRGAETAADAPVPILTFEDHTVSRAELMGLIRDRQRLVSVVSLEPVVHEGFLHGYRVGYVRSGSDLDGIGLKVGDVIVAVNGTPASQAGAFTQVISELREARAVSIGLERGNRSLTINYLLE
jgi:type II secretion system protein C